VTGDEQVALRKTVWTLAWPVIISYLSESMVGLVDTLMVGQLGAAAVAAVGVGAQIFGTVNIVVMAVGTGTLALVARHIGAREPREAQRILGQSIVTATVLAVAAVLPVLLWPRPFIRLFNVGPEVVELAVLFVRRLLLGVPGIAVVFVVAAGLRGAGDSRTPLLVGLIINLVNVVGNYVLIFGHLGFPQLGIVGSGIASAIAAATGALVAMALVTRGGLRLRVGRIDLRPDPDAIRRVLRIGLPAAGEQALMQIGFFFYLTFAAAYGTSAMAAYFIGVRILAVSFLPGLGFAAAASALVGQHLGAGRPDQAERAAWAANRMCVALMTVTGVIAFVFAEQIARGFVDDPAVVEGTIWFIYMLALAQPLMAMDYVFGGALRGAGDTRFPLIAVVVAFYGCRLGFAWLVTHWWHLGLPWLWAALLGDYVARAALKGWRLRGGAWKTLRV
jgi:putative MATE family efflux protein